MAILTGKDGTVTIGSGSALGEVSSWSASIEADTLETTAMGTGGWKTFVGSLQSWTGTVEMYLDPSQDVDDFVTGVAVNVSLFDGSNTYGGSGVITSVAIDVSAADLVTLTLDITGSGELTITN